MDRTPSRRSGRLAVGGGEIGVVIRMGVIDGPERPPLRFVPVDHRLLLQAIELVGGAGIAAVDVGELAMEVVLDVPQRHHLQALLRAEDQPAGLLGVVRDRPGGHGVVGGGRDVPGPGPPGVRFQRPSDPAAFFGGRRRTTFSFQGAGESLSRSFSSIQPSMISCTWVSRNPTQRSRSMGFLRSTRSNSRSGWWPLAALT